MTTLETPILNSAIPMHAPLPDGWQWKRFGELVNNFDGKRIPLKLEDRRGKEKVYPYYGASGIIDYVDGYLFDGDFLLVSEDGANLVMRSTPIAFQASGKFWVNNHAHVVQPKDGISLDYLRYFLAITDLKPYVTGAAQPKLTQNDLNAIPIAIPSTEEQQRIVVVLKKQMEAVERARAAAEAQLKAAKDLPAAYLRSVFDNSKAQQWKLVKLGELCEVKGGKRLPAGTDFAKTVTAYPYIRVLDFETGTVNTSNLKYLDESTQRQIARYIIKRDDVYISIAGSIGIVGVIPDELDGANLTENAARLVIRDKKHLDRDYLARFLQSGAGRDAIKLRTNFVGQPKLALERIATIEIPLAPYEQQKQIGVQLGEQTIITAQACDKLQDQLDSINKLPAALLRQAFTGKL
jgi:type I restriction enzyme S subunit